MPRGRLADRLYRLLIRCYPAEFRDEYEQEMTRSFHDRLTADRGLGLGAVLRLWMQVVGDSLLHAPREHDAFK